MQHWVSARGKQASKLVDNQTDIVNAFVKDWCKWLKGCWRVLFEIVCMSTAEVLSSSGNVCGIMHSASGCQEMH